MIPVRLTLQGIYSYQQEQTIDFTPLTGAGLFGIFGHVGSGKSTILEAMSFALFNKIDRLSGDRRNYNMMNLKSDRLFIDFEFMANDGISYRIEVTGRRNRKNFGDVPTFKRGFYRRKGDEWIPLEDNTAEKVTGLSYDNFHRTIIIPQGRFQEFLQLGVKERVTMLKELFGLNKYDLSDKTITLERENNERLQNLAGRFAQIGEVKSEDITNTRNQIEETRRSLEDLSAELMKFQARDRALEDLKKLSEEFKRQKDKLSELKFSEIKFSNMEKEVKEFETLYLAFHSDLEQYKASESILSKLKNDLEARKRDYDRYSTEYNSKQADLDTLKPQYERREDLLKMAEELKKLAQVLRLEESGRKLVLEIQKEKNALAALEKEIIDFRESARLTGDKLTLRKKELPDMRMLSEIRNWHRENKNFDELISAGQKALSQLNENLLDRRKDAFRILAELTIVNVPFESFKPAEFLLQIEKQHSEAEAALINLGPEISELEVQKKLETFAGELSEGKPCPLCGSTSHPHILDIHDVSEKLLSIYKRRADLESLVRKLTKGEKELTTVVREIAITDEQIRQRQENTNDLAGEQEKHLKTFTWDRFDPLNEQAVGEEMRRYDSLQSEIRELELKAENQNNSITNKEKIRKDLVEGIQVSDRKMTELSSQATLLTGQLLIIKKEAWSDRPFNELEEKAAAFQSGYQQLTEKYTKIEDIIKRLRSQIDTLKGTIETGAAQIGMTAGQTEILSQRIAGKLTLHGGITREYVVEVLNKNIDLEKTKKEITGFRAELDSAGNLLAKLEADLAGQEYPIQEHSAVKELIVKLQVQTGEKNQIMGQLKISLATLEINLKTLESLRKENDALTLRANNLSTLKNLFRGAAFVNFASRAYLENIAGAANVRFLKLTRRHLELVLDEDNNFMIRDHMNEGRLRSVKTLSGGQTFQASLSLALALADNVNRQVEADQNFFFLDEGFGSLDRESLETVFETLKSLRKENRIVGVISHVEEMQQEIDAHLLVTLDEENGSSIECSV